MNERLNDEPESRNEPGDDVRERSQTLRGGHDPARLGQLSGKARREKAKAREAEADWAKLTVSARWAQALAKTVDPHQLEAMIATQLELATDPTRGQTAAQAARLVLAMLTTAAPDGDDEVDPTKELEAMSPEQRAALRAMIQEAREQAERATAEALDAGAEAVDQS